MTCIDNNSQKNFFIFHELTNILAIHVCAIVCTINVHVLSVFVQCKSHAEFSLKKQREFANSNNSISVCGDFMWLNY
jgi:hypothetical protein